MENSSQTVVLTADEALENELVKSGYAKLLRQNKHLQSNLRTLTGVKDELSQKLDELQAGVLMIAELVGVTVAIGCEDKDLISEISERIEELTAIKKSKEV